MGASTRDHLPHGADLLSPYTGASSLQHPDWTHTIPLALCLRPYTSPFLSDLGRVTYSRKSLSTKLETGISL